jgi:sec-independent protein translocase protein TatA
MFGRIGMPEIIVVLVILLILFGGKKLPELARGLGDAIKELRKSADPDNDNKK